MSLPEFWARDQGEGMERCRLGVQPNSVGKCEGMSPHAPKWTRTLEIGVPLDF